MRKAKGIWRAVGLENRGARRRHYTGLCRGVGGEQNGVDPS